MTTADKLDRLGMMLDYSVDEDVLLTYLDIAGEGICRKAYPFDQTKAIVPDRYGYLQCEIAAYLINKRGAEGQLSHSENGVNRSYENAHIPASMLNTITPFCGVI